MVLAASPCQGEEALRGAGRGTLPCSMGGGLGAGQHPSLCFAVLHCQESSSNPWFSRTQVVPIQLRTGKKQDKE